MATQRMFQATLKPEDPLKRRKPPFSRAQIKSGHCATMNLPDSIELSGGPKAKDPVQIFFEFKPG